MCMYIILYLNIYIYGGSQVYFFPQPLLEIMKKYTKGRVRIFFGKQHAIGPARPPAQSRKISLELEAVFCRSTGCKTWIFCLMFCNWLYWLPQWQITFAISDPRDGSNCDMSSSLSMTILKVLSLPQHCAAGETPWMQQEVFLGQRPKIIESESCELWGKNYGPYGLLHRSQLVDLAFFHGKFHRWFPDEQMILNVPFQYQTLQFWL